MTKWIVSFFVLIGLMSAFTVHAGAPLDAVKTNVNAVLDVLRDPKLKGESGRKAKEQRIEAVADKLFDFIELSKRTLGLDWNKFSDAQRREFVSLYKGILKDAYVAKITTYTDEQVTFSKEIPLSANTVEVQSIIAAKGSPVSIKYRVIQKNSEWKVYDVVIEGVSLISNYRGQFREILANKPPDKLLETLRQKAGNK